MGGLTPPPPPSCATVYSIVQFSKDRNCQTELIKLYLKPGRITKLSNPANENLNQIHSVVSKISCFQQNSILRLKYCWKIKYVIITANNSHEKKHIKSNDYREDLVIKNIIRINVYKNKVNNTVQSLNLKSS